MNARAGPSAAISLDGHRSPRSRSAPPAPGYSSPSPPAITHRSARHGGTTATPTAIVNSSGAGRRVHDHESPGRRYTSAPAVIVDAARSTVRRVGDRATPRSPQGGSELSPRRRRSRDRDRRARRHAVSGARPIAHQPADDRARSPIRCSPDASGTAVVTVTVTDNGGTANGGVNTITQTFIGDRQRRSTRRPRSTRSQPRPRSSRTPPRRRRST